MIRFLYTRNSCWRTGSPWEKKPDLTELEEMYNE